MSYFSLINFKSIHTYDKLYQASKYSPVLKGHWSAKNVNFFGSSFLVKPEDDSLIKEPIYYPPYILNFSFPNGYERLANKQRLMVKNEIHLKQAIFITHPHIKVFGHFLVECVHKLIQLRNTKELAQIPILIPFDCPKYVEDYLKVLLPVHRIIKIKADQIAIVENLFGFHECQFYRYPNEIVEWFNESASKIAKETHIEKHEKIYISRRDINSKTNSRHLINEKEIEDIALENGCKLVNPEKLTIVEQISLFHNANLVVGEYGSGLHNTIYCKKGTKVLSLNYLNMIQGSLGISFGHKSYFLDKDVINQKQFSINPTYFKEIIKNI